MARIGGGLDVPGMSFQHLLQTVLMNGTGTGTKPTSSSTSKSPASVSVVGVCDIQLETMKDAIASVLSSSQETGNGPLCMVTSFTLPEEVDRGDFFECCKVFLCDDLSQWKDEESQAERTLRLCTCMKAATKAEASVCIGLVGEPSDYRRHLTKLCQDYPEFRWLVCAGRILNVQIKEARWSVDDSSREALLSWLTVEENSYEPQQLLDYKDMGEIFIRDLCNWLPGMGTLIRLFLLITSGLLGVFLTAVILISISHEPSEEKLLRDRKLFLRNQITRQRLGKCEWEPGDDAVALLSLQLHEPDWCFQSVENQRSIDRMEVHLLAALSRARHPTSRELTPTRLAQYINALLVTYQNPRDFHGHDLVSLLESHLLQQTKYARHNPFSHSMAVIALYNSRVAVDWAHLGGLAERQKPDGSFGNSIDETALATIAMACSRGEAGVEEVLARSVAWLLAQRTPEGAFGHSYSTALVLQALNVTGARLHSDDYHQTIQWLVSNIKGDAALRNVEIASTVLIVLSGQTVISIRNFTGVGKSGDRDDARAPLLLPHIYLDRYEGIIGDANRAISEEEEEEEKEEVDNAPAEDDATDINDEQNETNNDGDADEADDTENANDEDGDDDDDDDGDEEDEADDVDKDTAADASGNIINEAGGGADEHDRKDDMRRRCVNKSSGTVYTEYGESRACLGNSRQRYIDLLQAFCPRCIR